MQRSRRLSRSAHIVVTVTASSLLFLLTTAASVPSRGVPRPHDQHFAQQVEKAAELIREQTFRAPACRRYFEKLGVDLDVWLAPDQPPYVIKRPLDNAWRQSVSPICGGAQGQPPFEVLFIDSRCFQQLQICELASLLLHEMGHLARRDTRDHEPPDFFKACRLSPCIDPARFE